MTEIRQEIGGTMDSTRSIVETRSIGAKREDKFTILLEADRTWGVEFQRQ